MKVTIALLSLFIVGVLGQSREKIAACWNLAICDTEEYGDGKDIYFECLKEIPDEDYQIILEEYNKKFDEYLDENRGPTGRDLPEMLDKGCEDTTLGYEAHLAVVEATINRLLEAEKKNDISEENVYKWLEFFDCMDTVFDMCKTLGAQ